VWAALAVALSCFPRAQGATYASDAAYNFTGQDYSSSGRGIAVDGANTRLFVTYRKSAGGNVQVLDVATGAPLAPITVPAPTAINDIALSPDSSKLYIARLNSTSGTGEIDVADAAPGAAATLAIPFLDADSNSLGVPTSLAITSNGTSQYLAVTTTRWFYIFRSDAGGAWVQQTALDLTFSTAARKVIAQDTGGAPAFFVLTAGATTTPRVVQVSALDGSVPVITWDALPTAYAGYTFDSVLPGGVVDGVPSVFIAADSTDNDGNATLSVFRYGTDGTYQGDGFGALLSPSAPLSALQPLDSTPTLVPSALVGNKLYLGAIRPDQFLGADATVRVVISNSTISPVKVSGTVRDSKGVGVAGATVVVFGKNTPVATTAADGTYSFPSLMPSPSLKFGASKFGYVAASGTFAVPAGSDRTGVDFVLPGAVPTFIAAHAFAPKVPDGILYTGKYNTAEMPFYMINGDPIEDTLKTVAYTEWDSQGLYIAVRGSEPSIDANSAIYANQNMLTQDDNVQIYLDPPHRHDVKGAQNNLFQFAVNIPPLITGVTTRSPQKFQRRIFPTGSLAQSVSSDAWAAHVGYYNGGWVVEARINVSQLTPFGPLAVEGAEWGVLIARHRPTAHLDSRPTDFCTSNVQPSGFSDPTTWTDIRLDAAKPDVPGDVNNSGAVDFVDAIYALRMAGGLSLGAPAPGDVWPDPEPDVTLRNAVLAKGDVWPPAAPDGQITIEDALRLLRAASGLDVIH
jgi:hypothetical protein